MPFLVCDWDLARMGVVMSGMNRKYRGGEMERTCVDIWLEGVEFLGGFFIRMGLDA